MAGIRSKTSDFAQLHEALCLPPSSSVSIWAAIVSPCHLHPVPSQEVHAIIEKA